MVANESTAEYQRTRSHLERPQLTTRDAFAALRARYVGARRRQYALLTGATCVVTAAITHLLLTAIDLL